MNWLGKLIIFLIILLIVSIIGRWLWNSYLVPNVTFARPLRSWIDFLAILILIALLFGPHYINSGYNTYNTSALNTKVRTY